MGLSPSSLLDESKSNFLRGRAQADLETFAPVYRKQYLLAFLSHIHDEQVQHKEEHPQLLKQREHPPESDVLYMGKVLTFNDHRKWKQRFAVVRASYSLECHESFESFEKGTQPLYQLLPTGGTIFTTEEKYMEVVDKCFPDTNVEKDDFGPPADTIPDDFPVYLRLPYRKDYYFCLEEETTHADFISILSDCIRHRNQDFLKKKSYEVQAFARAVQLHRQAMGLYELWDMLIGSDARVLANLTMEKLLPTVGKDLLSGLKAKKSEKKRMWFAAVEEMYYLVQQTLMEGMNALKKDCREEAEKHAALMRSNMDQIMASRGFVEAKLRATVAEAAAAYCTEQVEPHLPALLEEVMGPISMGFMEARQLSEAMMERLCQAYQEGVTGEELQQAWEEMRRPDLQSCYEKVSGLRDHIKELQQRFSFPSMERLEQGTQIDIEQLVKNVAYTFELFLNKAKENKIKIADAMVKAKHRVLKQYDYDSSTVRKRIFHEALLSVTLPSVKAHLAPTFKNELPAFEQYIFADYMTFINVENIYEDIVQQILGDEITKVVNEAASMKKYNLFTDSKFQFSVSSVYSSPTGSKSSSPARPSLALSHSKPARPLLSQSPAQGQASTEQALTGPEGPAATELQLPAAEQGQRSTCSGAPGVAGAGLGLLANGTADTPAESVKEVMRTNTEPDPVASFSTGTPLEPPGSVHAESALTKPTVPPTETGQTLANPILSALETVTSRIGSNRMQNPSSTGGGTRPLNQAAPTSDSPVSPAVSLETGAGLTELKNTTSLGISPVLETASRDHNSKGAATVPPTGVDKWSDADAETEAVVDDPIPVRAPKDEVRNGEDKEAVGSAEESDLGTETMEVHPELAKPNESSTATCEAVADAEARAEAEAMAALASLAVCLADSSADSPKPGSSSPAEGSTGAQPATKPPDCIKEIRDLVVEVIEVEDVVQRYPDNGAT